MNHKERSSREYFTRDEVMEALDHLPIPDSMRELYRDDDWEVQTDIHMNSDITWFTEPFYAIFIVDGTSKTIRRRLVDTYIVDYYKGVRLTSENWEEPDYGKDYRADHFTQILRK